MAVHLYLYKLTHDDGKGEKVIARAWLPSLWLWFLADSDRHDWRLSSHDGG